MAIDEHILDGPGPSFLFLALGGDSDSFSGLVLLVRSRISSFTGDLLALIGRGRRLVWTSRLDVGATLLFGLEEKYDSIEGCFLVLGGGCFLRELMVLWRKTRRSSPS